MTWREADDFAYFSNKDHEPQRGQVANPDSHN